MVDSYLSTKFGMNSLDGFSENVFYGRMDRQLTGAALAMLRTGAENQAELNNTFLIKEHEFCFYSNYTHYAIFSYKHIWPTVKVTKLKGNELLLLYCR